RGVEPGALPIRDDDVGIAQPLDEGVAAADMAVLEADRDARGEALPGRGGGGRVLIVVEDDADERTVLRGVRHPWSLWPCRKPQTGGSHRSRHAKNRTRPGYRRYGGPGRAASWRYSCPPPRAGRARRR